MNKKGDVFFMSKTLLISTLFTLLFIAFTGSHKLQAAQIGDTFTDETGMITFEVKDTGKENICSVIGWKNEFDDVNLVNHIKLVIPETVVYEDTLYAVTSIESSSGTIYSDWISEMEIPASVKSIKVKHFTFGLEIAPEIEEVKDIHGVRLIFKCSPDAFEQIESITVGDTAIESIIYVPEEYLEEYKALFAGKLRCLFTDNDRGIRSYTGIPIAKIGDSSVNPEAFIFEDSYYRILNPDKKTVSLICSYALKKKGIKGTCYTQPSIVYYKGEKYKVTKIEYYAFCNVRFDEPVELKLPNTITSIESKSIGWNITRLDLSETKIKKIPKYLVNSYYDNYDESAKLKEVILPKTCKKLQKYAFYNCKKLKNIGMFENVNIGYRALRKKCNITKQKISPTS